MIDDELERMAQEAEEEVEGQFVRRTRTLEDFRYDETQAKYWDITTGTLLGPSSVNGAVPREYWPTITDAKGQMKKIAPAIAINAVETGLTVEGATWWPGMPRFIHDVAVTERGPIETEGAVCYNTYIEPVRKDTDADAGLWISHVKTLFPDPTEHEHFFNWAAHMLQRPEEKVNHGIVLAGKQGIGKDATLAPLRKGVGYWNTSEIDPDDIFSPYNSYIKSLMIVVNEVRPHETSHRAMSFYNALKPLLAAPPEMLLSNAKYLTPIPVRNLCRVVLTTNSPLSVHMPEDDRRLFILTSGMERNDFGEGYFKELYTWLNKQGGMDAVISWLLKRDISGFEASAPPPMTEGKDQMVQTTSEYRRNMVDDLIEALAEQMGELKVVFAQDLLAFAAHANLFDDVNEVKAALHLKLDDRGYVGIKNGHSMWKKGQFKTRTAFVHRSVPKNKRVALIKSELEKRPLGFGSEGKF
jgi:hypothetical protein